MFSKWRADRKSWLRSSGLRRRVLIEEEARTSTLVRIRERELDALLERMGLWQREDDAALNIQGAWRGLQLRRKQRLQLSIGLRMKGVMRTPDWSADESMQSATKLRDQLSKGTRSSPSSTSLKPLTVDVDLEETTEDGTPLDMSRALSDLVNDITSCLDRTMTSWNGAISHLAVREQADTSSLELDPLDATIAARIEASTTDELIFKLTEGLELSGEESERAQAAREASVEAITARRDAGLVLSDEEIDKLREVEVARAQAIEAALTARLKAGQPLTDKEQSTLREATLARAAAIAPSAAAALQGQASNSRAEPA